MGIGIIALSLFFLLGLKISVNEIALLPYFINLIILGIGLITCLQKNKNRWFILSIILLMLLMFDEFFHFLDIFSYLALLMMLFCIFKGIEEIAEDYPNLKKYQKRYVMFLIVFVIDFGLHFIFNHFLFNIFLFIIYFISLVLVEMELIKINHFLEEDYQDIPQVISYTFKQKTILGLCTLCCFGLFYMIHDDYTASVYHELPLKEEQYFKIDQDIYKITPFGYHTSKVFSLPFTDQNYYTNSLSLHIRNDYASQIHSIAFTITQNHQELVSSQQAFNKENPYNEIDGYQSLLLGNEEDQQLFDIDLFKQMKEAPTSLEIYFYDKNNKEIYHDQSILTPIVPQVQHIENEKFSFKVHTDMHSIFGEPQIKVYDSSIYLIEVYLDDLLIGTYDSHLNSYTYFLITNGHFVNQITIKCYDENNQLIDQVVREVE